MNACVLKPTLPFVPRKEIKKIPASVENRKRVEFMDSHNLFFSVDKKTGVLQSKSGKEVRYEYKKIHKEI